MIRALAFDFDGLVLDTETLDYDVWHEIYVSHGVHLDIDLWRQNVGAMPPPFNVSDHLVQLTGRPELAGDALSQRNERFEQRLVEMPTLPGIGRLMREAREAGLKVGVASNSDHDWVDPHLIRLGLMPKVDSVRCRDDVERSKPNPDVYLALCDSLQVLPSETVALEDSAIGCEAAERAGCHVVWVPNRSTVQMALQDRFRTHHGLQDIALSELIPD